MAPLPVATTLAPIWSSVMVKAWAGWTEKSDVTAVNVSEQRIAARICVFIVISWFGTDAGDYCRSKAYHWESPVVRTHRCQMNCRKNRGFKSSSNLPIKQKM